MSINQFVPRGLDALKAKLLEASWNPWSSFLRSKKLGSTYTRHFVAWITGSKSFYGLRPSSTRPRETILIFSSHDSEHGGFILPFLILLTLMLPLFFLMIDMAQGQLIGLRMNRIIAQIDHHEAGVQQLLSQGTLGITQTTLTPAELSVTYKPYIALVNNSETLTRPLIPPKAQANAHMVVALDMFMPDGELPYEVLFAELEKWVSAGHKLSIIPYAASINLGTSYPVTFPPLPAVTPQEMRFMNYSPKYAILNNRQGKFNVCQTPDKALWSGCISLKRRCDFVDVSPFFVPSTFGQKFSNEVYQGLMVTGPNNWTPATIHESGSVAQGPNIGCPPQILYTTEDAQSLRAYVRNLSALHRGGSCWPLALDYGLSLLKNHDGPHILFITKLSDVMAYTWPGPRIEFTDASNGYPKGDKPDTLGLAPENAAATLRDIANFKNVGGQVVCFFTTQARAGIPELWALGESSDDIKVVFKKLRRVISKK